MKKILNIDDDRAVLEALEKVLVYSGYRVNIGIHTDGVFKAINEYRSDLMILSRINVGEICHQKQILKRLIFPYHYFRSFQNTSLAGR